MVSNEGNLLKKVILCAPGNEYLGVCQFKQHNITEPAIVNEAILQHYHLQQTLSDFGAEVVSLPELPGHPNSTFTRDTAVVTPRGYIKLKMGLPSRGGEESWMADHLNLLKIPQYSSIKSPGTAEGGDIILAGKVVFIGNSSRTNKDAIHQLQLLFKRIGYEVRTTKVPAPFLHIGGAMSMIAPDTVLCCANIFPDHFFSGYKVIEIPNRNFISGNVISLGENQVIADCSNTVAIDLLLKNDVKVNILDFSEFVKGTGGPSCLIMPVERNLNG